MPLSIKALSIKVWDPFVRYGHWALVLAFAVAYLSAEEDTANPDQLHVWGGYAVGIIVASRIVWGVIGVGHARFSDFAYGPRPALHYLTDLLRGRAHRFLGHSPAAAVMIFALLICLILTVWTGLVAYGHGGHGPLARAVSGGEGDDSGIADLHAILANITLGLVILHILGVGLASYVHRENLILAMFTGRKRPGEGT